MTTENQEVLQDFAEIIADLEEARKVAFEKNEHNIGHKISGIISSFKAFTEEEIVTLGNLM